MVSAIDPTKPKDGVAARKSDLRANLTAAKNEIEELQIRKIEDGMPINMNGSLLTGAVLSRYAEVGGRATIDSGRLVIDLSMANVFEIMITEHVTSIHLLNPPPANQTGNVVLVVTQDQNGGWSFAWPEAVMWPEGVAPRVSATPSATDIYGLITINGGTRWFGFECGRMFR